MSLTNEQQQDNLAKVKLAVDSAFSTDALSPWQDADDIFDYDSQGKVTVNTPSVAFSDIGQLFDFEEAMLNDFQDGLITYEDFRAAQSYVLDYSLRDTLDNFDAYTGDKPAGKRAFYSVVSEDDNALSTAEHTELLKSRDTNSFYSFDLRQELAA